MPKVHRPWNAYIQGSKPVGERRFVVTETGQDIPNDIEVTEVYSQHANDFVIMFFDPDGTTLAKHALRAVVETPDGYWSIQTKYACEDGSPNVWHLSDVEALINEVYRKRQATRIYINRQPQLWHPHEPNRNRVESWYLEWAHKVAAELGDGWQVEKLPYAEGIIRDTEELLPGYKVYKDKITLGVFPDLRKTRPQVRWCPLIVDGDNWVPLREPQATMTPKKPKAAAKDVRNKVLLTAHLEIHEATERLERHRLTRQANKAIYDSWCARYPDAVNHNLARYQKYWYTNKPVIVYDVLRFGDNSNWIEVAFNLDADCNPVSLRNTTVSGDKLERFISLFQSFASGG